MQTSPNVATQRAHRSTTVIVAALVVLGACKSSKPTQPNEQDPNSLPVATVWLDRNVLHIEQGKSASIVAIPQNAQGNSLTGRAVTWSSSATSIATVNQSGVVTAVAVGSTKVRATSEGKFAEAEIVVTPIPVASVVMSAAQAELEVGESATFTAEARAANGQVLTGRTITWAVADATVVSIANGVVTALAPGETTISAASEGKVATANVIVKAPPSCASSVPTGRLTAPSADEFRYESLEGWDVSIRRSQLQVQAPGQHQTNSYEFWGSNHENIHGKHIKDLLDDRRTILLPGGVIITVHTDRESPPNAEGMSWVRWISIYEADESHRIDFGTFSVVQSCSLPMFGEAEEYDGEAGRLYLDDIGMLFDNVYQQDADGEGVPLAKVHNLVQLARTFFSTPNQVHDFFDDPRLGHTF